MEAIDLAPEQAIKNNIYEFRKATGLSQKQFAERVGLSRPGYEAIESGTTRILNDKVEHIAKTFGISVQELILGRKAVESTDPMLREEILSRDERISAIRIDYESRLAEKQKIIDQQFQLINTQNNMIDFLVSQLDKND